MRLAKVHLTDAAGSSRHVGDTKHEQHHAHKEAVLKVQVDHEAQMQEHIGPYNDRTPVEIIVKSLAVRVEV